ncbi:Laccase-2 [Lasiodiplodia theobromae]|uniref:Laccase-2 n=1 Tax=Lasiodiplodia theobromae TaxID=45133 RepID=A0A5N5DU00_9PEZI|nr:Laccase-2 [Lasiodiplodia theobromae]
MRAPFLWSLLFAGGLAAPQAASSTSSASASACTGNTANDRSTWCDYDLQTDWYTEVPDTGVTVEYWFEVTNTTVSPDGIERIGLAVNGSIPGPTIEANWGDTVASANYDEDIGPVMLSDWSHQTADELYTYAQTQGPPELNNALINGLNVYNNSGTITGSRWETTVTSGNSYRLRLVNTAIDMHFKFMIDNHTLTVIAMDFVPIEPYETEYLDINMGQRYDVIVSANQDEGDYWIRAIPQTACSANDNVDNIRAILRYDSSSTADPTTTAYSNMTNECVDEPYASLVPALAQNPTSLVETDSSDMPVTIGVLNNLFKWYISAKTMAVEWGNPTTLSVYGGKTDWTDNDHVVELATANEWVYFVIETAQGVPHPFHLHGNPPSRILLEHFDEMV